MDYFDPEGVSTLSKSLDPAVETHSSGQTTSGDWQTTLKEGAEIPFNFEQTLRDYIKKSISFVLYIASPPHLFPRKSEAGIKSRELGVAFENLWVIGLGASASYQSTLGSLLNPLNILSAIKNVRHPPLRDIISGFEGVVRPGEMLCMEYLTLDIYVD